MPQEAEIKSLPFGHIWDRVQEAHFVRVEKIPTFLMMSIAEACIRPELQHYLLSLSVPQNSSMCTPQITAAPDV